MYKKLLLLTVAFMLLGTTMAKAADEVKVAVFPFDIFSTESLGHLRLGLQDMVKTRLSAEGWKVLAPTEVNQALTAAGKPLDLTLARQIAGKLGADYAVYGSLTKIGSRVSLDAKLLDVLGMRRPQSFYVEGVELAALDSLADRLARDLASSAVGGERVAEVKVSGNRRIEADAVKGVLKTKAGGPYSPLRLDEDLRAVWKMGYFKDVRVEVVDSPEGKVVTIKVKEKPTIGELKITGNEEIDTKDLVDRMDLKVHSVFNPGAVKEAERKIVEAYQEDGYYDVKVTSQVTTLTSGEMGVLFKVEEGKKVVVAKITFEGNKAFSDSELRDEMSTQQTGWLSWLSDDNLLNRDKLDQDVEKIADFYYNQGYIEAKVSAPEVNRGKEGLDIVIRIVEGTRYKVADLSLHGDLILPKEEVLAQLKTKSGDWYNRQKLRDDIRTLSDVYASRGYAYVDVQPGIRQNPKKATVDVAFAIKKGAKVYFENILITGNDRTRDNVIRRELSVAEGDLFSSTALRDANMRLYRLNFFEDVHIIPSRGSAENRMNLHLKVKEKRTDAFSVGAGYSSVDGLMLMGQLSFANLFGRGQQLSLRGQLGGKSTRYTISFTEPWLFDRPISAGIDLFNWDREYVNYDKGSVGGRLRLGFPTPLDNTRFYTYYEYDRSKISNVDDDAALVIKDQAGIHTTSSIRVILRRDTRDHFFNPTQGSDNSVSVEYAGGPLGGSNSFTKVLGDTGWYLPLWLKHVLVLHGRIGWVGKNAGGDLPIYEKFFLGGINTLRGYDYWTVSPKDPATGDPIGGEYMLLANIEYRFPLVSKAGLVGVVFFDAGNAWSKSDGYRPSDLRKSYGAGIRWYSPVGPLRLEYGRVIDPQEGESDSNWEFTIGSVF